MALTASVNDIIASHLGDDGMITGLSKEDLEKIISMTQKLQKHKKNKQTRRVKDPLQAKDVDKLAFFFFLQRATTEDQVGF